MHHHQLPPEILAQIFLATQCFNSCKYPCDPTNQDLTHSATLSNVCRTWRCVSLGLPRLWSHIDLVTQWVSVADAASRHVRLLEERSAGALIDLCILVHEDPTVPLSQGGWIDKTATEEVLAQLVDILTPLAPRIFRLHIHSSVYTASEMQPILAAILKTGTEGVLNALTTCSADKLLGSGVLLPWAPWCISDPPSNNQIYQFMQSIRSLRLYDSLILWGMSNVYFGLTELSIDLRNGVYFPSSDDMVLILSSCPELRLLSLNNVVVDSYIPPDPIILEQLQQLELRCDYAEYLIPLLRLLHPKDQCLTIRIDVAEGFEFAAQFRDFFRRTPMLTTLHIRPEDKTTWFASLPASSNKLSALTLEGCDFSDPVLARFVSAEPENNHIMLWPMLRSLRLVRCILDLDTLSYMTINRSLEILELAGCEIQNPATKTYDPATLSMLEQFDTSVINILVRSEE